MNLTCGTMWICSRSHNSFPSTSVIPLSTNQAAVLIISQFRRAISAVALCCIIAVIATLAFVFSFLIRTCARACCWNSALFTTEAISSSGLLGSGMPSSLLITLLKLVTVPGSWTITWWCCHLAMESGSSIISQHYCHTNNKSLDDIITTHPRVLSQLQWWVNPMQTHIDIYSLWTEIENDASHHHLYM